MNKKENKPHAQELENSDNNHFNYFLFLSASSFIIAFTSRFPLQEQMSDFFGSSENRAVFEHFLDAFGMSMLTFFYAKMAKNKLNIISSDEKKWQNFLFCFYLPLYLAFQTWWELSQSQSYNRDFQWDQYIATWLGIVAPILISRSFSKIAKK